MLLNACGFINEFSGRSLYRQGKKRFGESSYTKINLATLLSLPNILVNAFTPTNEQFINQFRELHQDYE